MTEELGKIEKPEAGDIIGQRKLYVVPLVYSLPGAPDGYGQRLEAYWKAVDQHLSSLEAKAGIVKKVFHEGISYGGDPGIDQLKQTNFPAFPLINTRLQGGASLEALDDDELFMEVLDWGRMAQVGFNSQKVADTVQEAYNVATEARMSHITTSLDTKLGPGEAGLVIISSLRGVVTPKDVEIFNIMPPELDQLNRWIEEQVRMRQAEIERAQAGQAAPSAGAGTEPQQSDDGPGLWTPGSA
ncbi:MAG: hypothetical protein HQ478_07910 [Chloroflexi bacterium]|nr:hypothetical protein [Chloroflexota bacterium]